MSCIKNKTRILRDKKMLLSNPLIDNNIIVIHDPENIQISRACIIGPKGTPYKNGFYFFEFLFPDNYPYEPLKVKFYTNNGITRMHPNFYTCGKVCVSIIGTWTGPGWTSCQTLSSVLLTFLSLFIKNPLHQEPGYDKDYTSRNKNYNYIIHHENFKIGMINMINHIPMGFEDFLPIITEYLYFHKDEILSDCTPIHSMKTISSPSIWNFKINIDYKKLYTKLEEIINNSQIIPEDSINKLLETIEKEISLKDARKVLVYPEYDLQSLLNILQIRKKIKVVNGIIFKLN